MKPKPHIQLTKAYYLVSTSKDLIKVHTGTPFSRINR